MCSHFLGERKKENTPAETLEFMSYEAASQVVSCFKACREVWGPIFAEGGSFDGKMKPNRVIPSALLEIQPRSTAGGHVISVRINVFVGEATLPCQCVNSGKSI